MFAIRRYREGDRVAVWSLHNRALDEAGVHGGNGPWDDDLHDIRRTYLDAGGEFLVATINDRVIGMGALVVHPDCAGEIKRMRVEPGHQGGGIGRALLERLEQAAAARDIVRLFLDTTEKQTAARHLYTSAGYVEEGRGTVGRFNVIKYGKSL